jgi:GR25 family glycosyltransferase involved in LPS biosynthesis
MSLQNTNKYPVVIKQESSSCALTPWYSEEKSQLVIPKIIHRIWITFDPNNPDIPKRYQESDSILKALHPDWEFIEWNEAQILDFISEEYPELIAIYLSYDVPVKRHDFSRYLILNKFGGVFIQHSFVFQKNIEPLIGQDQLVFSTKMADPKREDELANNFMGSIENHPFWKYMISNLVKSANIENVMSATGPFLLTKTLKEYQAQNNDHSIKVLNYKYLFPFYFFDKDRPGIKENCIDASDLKQCFKIFPDVYAYCPWTSSWTNKSNQQAKVSVPEPNLSQSYTKILIMSLEGSKERSEKISNTLTGIGVDFEIFRAVNVYNVTITDPETGKSYKGIDIKRKVINLPIDKDFFVECANGVEEPTTITLRGYKARLMAGNIGVACTKFLIRKKIIENKYPYYVVLEDDFQPNSDNFVNHLEEFIDVLPRDWGIAYLHCHVKNRSTIINTNNSLVLTHSSNSSWYGDWAHIVSYQGAIELNNGYRFVGASDDYAQTLAKQKRINAYFASHNFSAVHSLAYNGHNNGSISTKMGCRDFHPSNRKDCDFNQVMPDQIYVINLPEKKERWNLISENSAQHNLSFVKFVAVHGYDVKITDLQANKEFFGIDIRNNLAQLDINQQYKITCLKEDQQKTEFNFTGYVTNEGRLVDAGALGIWCSNVFIWEDAQKNNYNRILILEDDVTLRSDFTALLNNFSIKLPRTFDLAYLDFKLFTNSKTLTPINKYVNGFTSQASGSRAHAIIFSAGGIDKLLSLKDSGFKYPIDHFYWCLNNGKTKVFEQHPSAECDKYIGFLETYATSVPLVSLNDFARNSSIDQMGRASDIVNESI